MTYQIIYKDGSKEVVEKITIEIIRRTAFLDCKIYKIINDPKKLKDE